MIASRAAVFSVCAAALLAHARPCAAQPHDRLALSLVEREVIARTFAPMLVFHPAEEYFPTSSMASDASAPGDGRGSALVQRPGAWPARVAEYRARSLPEKLQRAALGYRVFSRVHRGRTEVIVEYWCYYVYNAFTVRGGWLPYRVQVDHPHDLERVYVVLTPTGMASELRASPNGAWARAGFRIQRLIANAHDGSIPPNQYDVRDDETLTLPVALLVERGSHAMAPDVNHDGRFTPGVDSTSLLKLQWGVRDTGSTWGWYRASFMDRRDETAVRLCGPDTDLGNPCARYALYLVDDLQRWFGEFELSRRDRTDIFGRLPWVMRIFGDIRLENLMVPRDPPDGRVLDEMRNRPNNTEGGFVAGFTTVRRAPALVLGRRVFWDVRSRRSPDFVAEVAVLLPRGARREFETTAWASYSIDAITNVIVGGGWFSKAGTADVVTGLDLRVGRFRVRPIWKVRAGGFDARVTTTF